MNIHNTPYGACIPTALHCTALHKLMIWGPLQSNFDPNEITRKIKQFSSTRALWRLSMLLNLQVTNYCYFLSAEMHRWIRRFCWYSICCRHRVTDDHRKCTECAQPQIQPCSNNQSQCFSSHLFVFSSY